MLSKDEFLAYGPNRHGLETVMRMQAVKRWHMIETTRTQTLAEHSTNVALLVHYVVNSLPEGQKDFFGFPDTIVRNALLHDVEECFTGDIPTHTKRHLGGLPALELAVIDPIFKQSNSIDHEERVLIKLCDLADGIRFIRFHGVDMTATHAMTGLEKQLRAKFDGVMSIWPDDVFAHVRDSIAFYAYETSRT